MTSDQCAHINRQPFLVHPIPLCFCRLLLILVLVEADVVELDLEAILGGSDDSEPVTELRSLEVLLGEVLEVSLGEWDRCDDVDLALAC